MVDPVSIATSLGGGILKLKSTIEQLSENQEDIRILMLELIDVIEELTALRNSYIGNRISELDRTLKNLILELAAVCVGCEALLPKLDKGRSKRAIKWLKDLYYANSVKKKISRLDRRVRNAQLRFLVTNGTHLSLRMAASERSYVLLRLTTIDLTVCSKQEKLTIIQVKLRSLEASLENAMLILGSNTATGDIYIPQPNDPFYNVVSDPSGTWRRQDALSEIVTLLDILQDSAEVVTTSIIVRFTRANCLSVSMRSLGLREESVMLCLMWNEIIQKLTECNCQSFQEYKAQYLLTLSDSLSDVGKTEKALVAIEEATGIYRELAKGDLDTFKALLASSLNNMSNRLSDVGQWKGALTAVEEAVEIRRDLARMDPDSFNPPLASSLNNMSGCLSDVGQRKKALAAIEEATDIYRDLARANADTFNPGLAMALNNLANRLGDVGEGEKALVAIQEAIDIYRELARMNPDAFISDLAMSLYNLAYTYHNRGQWTEAVDPIKEAVDIYRGLAQRYPAVFSGDLVDALDDLTECLEKVGRMDEALGTLEEANRIRSISELSTPRH